MGRPCRSAEPTRTLSVVLSSQGMWPFIPTAEVPCTGHTYTETAKSDTVRMGRVVDVTLAAWPSVRREARTEWPYELHVEQTGQRPGQQPGRRSGCEACIGPEQTGRALPRTGIGTGHTHYGPVSGEKQILEKRTAWLEDSCARQHSLARALTLYRVLACSEFKCFCSTA
jgi:hypothetical protein